jgi:hypothetical protein
MLDDLLSTVGGTPGRILGVGLALGVGIVIGRGMRPVAKNAIKGYMTVSERLREYAAEAGEGLQDLYHEAKAERDQAAGGAPSEAAESKAA